MSTERNMKNMGSSFGSIALSLLVLASAGLVWCGTPAQSATTTQAAAPAPSATVDSTLSIPVSGSVTAADGTKITFAGNVTVKSSAVTNVVGIPPFVMLTFDCSGVNATSGAGAKLKTYDTTGFQVNKIRTLQPNDVITITVPVNQIGAGVTLANAWQVTATLSFNTTGQLTGGTLSAAAAPTPAPATTP